MIHSGADVPLGIKAIEACGTKSQPTTRLRKYQLMVLLLTFLTYMSYHLTRKVTSVVKSTLNPKVDDDWDNINSGWYPFNKGEPDADGARNEGKALLGLLDTTFLFAYAVGMFFSGSVADRSNLRIFLSGSMITIGILMGVMGLANFWEIHDLWYFLFVQAVTGLYQATGWPSVVSVVGKWFPRGKRGLVMGIWNSHTSVGNILGALIPAAVLGWGWGWAFIVPGIIIAGLGIIMYFFLIVCTSSLAPPTPVSICCSHQSAEDTEKTTLLNVAGDVPVQHQAVSFWKALFIPGVISFSLCLFFCKLVAYTFMYWLPYYVQHTKIGGHTLSDSESANLSTLFDVGGIAGGILAGFLSDRLRKPALINAFFLYIAVPMLFIYHTYSKDSTSINIFLLLITGAIVNAPYALITTAVSADLGTHETLRGNPKALATVTAIIDGTGSIGAAIGPYLAGSIKSWDDVFWMLMASAAIAGLMLTRQCKDELCGKPKKQEAYTFD
ncbi:uncharacterized protein MONBRDRAFT_17222 [Monosiga brevicollis MX1]|uniref:Major facilitator superfamily (MFS) profile domain-containing protein n=1 Tax=Monosiga brevicollis TaxID=81824 RepID=A9UQ81_MONBE|nr:uncharacterized protein MONBRDRAFT_17222 [Monosiga brevicollis MX1]EDQ92550.1 predicted protein [Monosiga brevicollis MX1]|eukprot:XP_001742312.1 hypothetical protein [Monosiga brevicollis MX1]